MKIHNWDKNRKLISKEDWISVNSGKKIGLTLTETSYSYLNYSPSGKRLNNKKGWITTQRNVTEDQYVKEYTDVYFIVDNI